MPAVRRSALRDVFRTVRRCVRVNRGLCLTECIPHDVVRSQRTSVTKAKHAISSYRKAVGDPAGLADLMVFCCETAAGFCADIASDDESYLAALVRMFEKALTATTALPAEGQDALVKRLARVCKVSQNIGYGVGEDMEFLLAKYTQRRETV